MNRGRAVKLDKGSKYVSFDEETDCYGIFGTESGFCYALYASRDEASDKLSEEEKEEGS